MFPAHRVRSLAQSTRTAEIKRHRVSEHIQIEIDADTSLAVDTDSERLRVKLQQYQILCNTWAMAGCFDVVIDAKTYKYCHWQQADKYQRGLRERTEHLLDRYSEASVLLYLLRTEEQLRGYAIEATRCKENPVRWGLALVQALREYSHLWMDNRDLLLPKRVAGMDTPRHAAPPPQRTPPRQQQQSRLPPRPPQPAAPDLPATAPRTSQGARICKRFNDRRGCKPGKCPKGEAHVCDVVLAQTRQVCGKSDHNRLQHDSTKHGPPARRD
jgi:hypothetical protein